LARPPGVDSIPQDSATTPQVDTVGPVFSDTTSRPPPDSLVTTLKDTTAQKDRAITNKQVATDSALLVTHIKRVESVPLSTQLGHDAMARSLAADSKMRGQAIIPPGGEEESLIAGAIAALSRAPIVSIHTDSLVNDTANARIIKAS